MLDLLDRCRFPPPGTDITCAVSGGADSLSLLVLAVAAGCRVEAVHVDHGLRPGSSGEAEKVAQVAAALGAGFRAERVVVEPGPNLEARARTARYSVLPAGVATGHTADDQAETMLINLMRGAGLDGLAAMEPGPRHPILGLRRHETRELCRSEGLEPIEDPTNTDPAYVRNRVRHEVIPLLNEIAGRDVADVLARQAAILRAEAAALDELGARVDPTDARAVAAAPVAVARRALRQWLSHGQPHPPSSAAVARVLEVATGAASSTDVGGGRRVARTARRLRIQEPPD